MLCWYSQHRIDVKFKYFQAFTYVKALDSSSLGRVNLLRASHEPMPISIFHQVQGAEQQIELALQYGQNKKKQLCVRFFFYLNLE